MAVPPPTYKVFDEIARAKAETLPPRPAVTRLAGFLIGGLMGLAFTLAAWLGQEVSLPGVPLDPGSLGPGGRMLAAIAVGAALFGLAGWPQSLGMGLLLADLAALGLGVGWLWLRASDPLSTLLVDSPSIYGLLLVMVVVIIGTPCFLLGRMAAEAQGEHWFRPAWDWRRLKLPLYALILAALFGLMTLHAPRARETLLRMDGMVRRAQSGAVPGPMAGIPGLESHARLPYHLRISTDPNLRNELSHNLAPHDQLILAEFEDGWTLACLFKDGIDMVICRGD